MTLDEIVSDYIRKYRDDARAEMRFFEIQRRPSEAIRKAALCVLPSGKRHPHQRRIPKSVLEQAEAQRLVPRGLFGLCTQARFFDFALHSVDG